MESGSYRATDELLSINAITTHETIEKSQNSSDTWSLFTATNSEYLKWTLSRSDGISDMLNLTHYIICTPEWTIEVLEAATPKVFFVYKQDRH